MLCLQYQYTLLFYKMARQAIDLADSARKSDMQVNTKDLLVAPGAGEAVALGGVGVIFKLSGEETEGAFSIVEHPIEPGTLVLPHTHSKEHELSYVLEGEVGVRIGNLVMLMFYQYLPIHRMMEKSPCITQTTTARRPFIHVPGSH